MLIKCAHNLIYLLCLIYSSLLFAFQDDDNNSLSKNNTDLSYFIQKAEELNLGDSSEWQKILFFHTKLLRYKRGIVSDKRFYFSKKGRRDSHDELIKTLEAFFSGLEGDSSPQCLFPRRLKWLKAHLDSDDLQIPTVECQKMDDWINMINPQGVVFIFSSFYINNPSTMFGHTFLRIINSDHTLTDSGVNFAANPDTDNMLMYTVKGLTGMFEGKFSLLPYSVKVQEYNNSESRDMWEYELNISKEQTFDMMLSLWEVGDNRIDYYYFDQNCSTVMLALLDSIDDSFNFTDRFLLVVNPPDTVRFLTSHPNLVKKVHFRPSAKRRFQSRYSLLNSKETSLFAKVIDNKINSSDLASHSSNESAAKILTAVSEYIDFKEHLAGTEESKIFSSFRKDLLIARAELGIVSPPLDIEVPKNERPDKGNDSSRMGPFYNYSNAEGNCIDFELRPTLHSIDSVYRGYSKEAQIELANTDLRFEFKTHKIFVNKFYLINILSVPSLEPPLYPLSWGIQLALLQDEDCQAKTTRTYNPRCRRYFIGGLSGYAFGNKWVHGYLLPGAQFSYMNLYGLEGLFGGQSGILFYPNEFITFYTTFVFYYRYALIQHIWRKLINLESSLSFYIAKNFEGKVYVSYFQQSSEFRVGAGVYWYFF